VHFDLVVIGGGSGGMRAARLAGQAGKRVALVEDGMMGGTCVNVGCIPKKLYVNAGLFHHYHRLALDYGWQMEEGRFSLAALRQAKDREITRLREVYRRNALNAGVKIFDGCGRFASNDRLRVGDIELMAEKFLIATGTVSTMPADFPGIALAHNSDAVFGLEAMPQRVLVYGGGYIAVELAGVLARLGSKVDLVYRGERILKNFDPDLTTALQNMLPYDGICLHLKTQLVGLERQGDGVAAITDTGERIESNFVLFALGRHANIDSLGLETSFPGQKESTRTNGALRLTSRGYIDVDEQYQTSIPGIYALGDVVGTPQLTPMAIAQAMDFQASHFALGYAPARSRYVPTCIFSQPPLGTVGMLESQLRTEGRAYHCFSGSFIPLHLSLGEHHERVHFKILVEQATDLVVGAHILADYAGEIIQTMAAAMESGITKAQLDATLAVHPSIAEELVTSYTPTHSWRP